MTYRTGESPDLSRYDVPEISIGEGIKGHKVLISHGVSPDKWILSCECGKIWRSARWHCEESYFEHLPVEGLDTWGGYHDHNTYISGAAQD
ncbi:MAG: hypothetical protein WC455_20825 [Dehalococcoidia bacterium]|jgi:hypothetical protein